MSKEYMKEFIPGRRIIKTAISLLLCLILGQYFKYPNMLSAAIASVVFLKKDARSALDKGQQSFISLVYGLLIALTASTFMEFFKIFNPIHRILVIVASLMINFIIGKIRGQEEAVILSSLTIMLGILLTNGENDSAFINNIIKFGETIAGALIATTVNVIFDKINPSPKFKKRQYPFGAHVLEHQEQVKDIMGFITSELKTRASNHDDSKLEEPEYSILASRFGHIYEYGSESYIKGLEIVKPALDHHYKNNDHHPEYFGGDVGKMNVLQITEMIVDWYSMSNKSVVNMMKSLELNRKRFNLDDQMYDMIKNTILYIDDKLNPDAIENEKYIHVEDVDK